MARKQDDSQIEGKEAVSQLIVTFEEQGSTRFGAEWKGVEPLQMVALAEWLLIRARLVIETQEAAKMHIDQKESQ